MNTKVREEKKPYEKPTLHVIDLAADEVLGVGCKTSSDGPNCSNVTPAGYTTSS
jgi:hypothetical protein